MNPWWEIPEPTPLPKPPLWRELLFEEPSTSIVILSVAAVLTLVVLWRRDAKLRSLVWPLVLAWLAGVNALLAALVVTDREELAASTRRLVAAVAAVDVGGVAGALSTDAELRYFGAESPVGRDEIVRRVDLHFRGREAVKSVSIQEMRIDANAGRGRVQVRVTAEPAMFPTPIVSWWELEWRQEGGAWRVTRIRPTFIQGFNGDPGVPR